jgi:hypothetical protein
VCFVRMLSFTFGTPVYVCVCVCARAREHSNHASNSASAATRSSALTAVTLPPCNSPAVSRDHMPTPAARQIPVLEEQALEKSLVSNVSEQHAPEEDPEQMKNGCLGACTPAQNEWWKTEGMKYIILALFLMTIVLLGVGVWEITRKNEVEPE